MSCDHLIYSPTDQAHILPCRHKFCIPCVESIEGLMLGDVFSCPVCGGYSQYKYPRRNVFGEEKTRDDGNGVKSESDDNYINEGKERTSTGSNLTKRYDEEGRCLVHKRFIAFSCEQCNILLCELCKLAHGITDNQHTISRLKEERQYIAPHKMTLGSVEDSVATVRNDKDCKHHFMPYTMYCKRCKRMLCRSCLDIHSQYCISGEVVSLRDMRRNMYTTFSEHLHTIDGWKRSLESVSQATESNVAYLLEEADKLKERVKKATEEVIQQLLKNQETMMEQVDIEVKRKTTKHQTCADEVNKIFDTLKPLQETAEDALKSVEGSNFAVAQIAEQELIQNMSDLKRKMSYKDYVPPSREHIPLRCEVKRIARYNKWDGDSSEAPVRLNKSTKHNNNDFLVASEQHRYYTNDSRL